MEEDVSSYSAWLDFSDLSHLFSKLWNQSPITSFSCFWTCGYQSLYEWIQTTRYSFKHRHLYTNVITRFGMDWFGGFWEVFLVWLGFFWGFFYKYQILSVKQAFDFPFDTKIHSLAWHGALKQANSFFTVSFGNFDLVVANTVKSWLSALGMQEEIYLVKVFCYI